MADNSFRATLSGSNPLTLQAIGFADVLTIDFGVIGSSSIGFAIYDSLSPTSFIGFVSQTSGLPDQGIFLNSPTGVYIGNYLTPALLKFNGTKISNPLASDLNFISFANNGDISIGMPTVLIINGATFFDTDFKIYSSNGNPLIDAQGNSYLDGAGQTIITSDHTFFCVDGSAAFLLGPSLMTMTASLKVANNGLLAHDGSSGISTTITTALLVGKTITVKDGLITGFA